MTDDGVEFGQQWVVMAVENFTKLFCFLLTVERILKSVVNPNADVSRTQLPREFEVRFKYERC